MKQLDAISPNWASGKKDHRYLRIPMILLSLLAAIAINEEAVRFGAPQFDPKQQVRFEDPDGDGPLPTLGPKNTVLRQTKNAGDFDVTIRFNRYGFRDVNDIAAAKADDDVLVGDSFAFGWGVEEEQRLSNLLGKKLGNRVFNIAITGNFDTFDETLKYAKSLGAQIHNLIVCVTMEADLGRYNNTPPPTSPSPLPIAAQAPSVPDWHSRFHALKVRLLANSALYFMATTLTHRYSWAETMAVKVGLIEPNSEGIRRHEFDPEIIESSAQRLAALAAPYHTTIVLIPSRGMWLGDRMSEDQHTHEAFHRRLLELDLDVVDLRPAFEAGGAPLKFHFKNDGHWNPAGHALAAEIVAAHIQHRPPVAP